MYSRNPKTNWRERVLRKRTDFEYVYQNGELISNSLFRIRYCVSKVGHLRFAIRISRGLIKKSSRRNRLRRLIKEYMRRNYKSILPMDLIISPQDSGLWRCKYKQIENFLDFLLGKSKLKI